MGQISFSPTLNECECFPIGKCEDWDPENWLTLSSLSQQLSAGHFPHNGKSCWLTANGRYDMKLYRPIYRDRPIFQSQRATYTNFAVQLVTRELFELLLMLVFIKGQT